MPPPGPWLELSRIGELIGDAACRAAILTALALAAIATWRLARCGLCSLWSRLHSLAHHGTAHRFALDVAAGHFDEAEGAAARALGGPGGRGLARHGPLPGWDERLVVDRLDSTPSGAGPCDVGAGGGWPLGLLQPPDAGVLIGRCPPIRLRLLSWRPAGTGSVRFAADARGIVLAGHLLVRPAPGRAEAMEIWVHLEGPRTRRGRRVLRVTRRATRSRLRAWDASGDLSRVHRRRRWARTQQARRTPHRRARRSHGKVPSG
jgi:hypothetical protein